MHEEIKHIEVSAQIFSLRFWIADINAESLKFIFNKFLSVAKFNVLKFSEFHFPVQGYTAFWLLSESHLAIHTFPQERWSYVELSSCNEGKTIEFKTKINQAGIDLKWETEKIVINSPNVNKKINN